MRMTREYALSVLFCHRDEKTGRPEIEVWRG